MDGVTLILFILGLVALVVGAELLVRGASRLAAAVGISPLVIGLTVVAFGTSAPELAVSVRSSLAGQADIALGNVVGSNIFNVLFILGACALIAPLVIHQQLVRLDVPLMIGISFLLFVLALDGQIGRLDGLLLFVGIIAYTSFAIFQSRKETAEIQSEYAQEYSVAAQRDIQHMLLQVVIIMAGLGLLVLGSQWLVDGAVAIARSFGVSQLVIGLTIVAAGTSLPEVATSIVATMRGERDIAVGNVIGSNIFNMLSILGLTGLIAPIAVAPAALSLDIPVMIAVAVACLPIFFTEMQIARWEGGLFLASYVIYTVYLILKATGSAALPLFGNVVLFGGLPIIAVMLIVLSGRTFWLNRRRMMEERSARS